MAEKRTIAKAKEIFENNGIEKIDDNLFRVKSVASKRSYLVEENKCNLNQNEERKNTLIEEKRLTTLLDNIVKGDAFPLFSIRKIIPTIDLEINKILSSNFREVKQYTKY